MISNKIININQLFGGNQNWKKSDYGFPCPKCKNIDFRIIKTKRKLG